jgi:hypothetical protein
MASNGEMEVLKKSRFTGEQTVTMLREAERIAIVQGGCAESQLMMRPRSGE